MSDLLVLIGSIIIVWLAIYILIQCLNLEREKKVDKLLTLLVALIPVLATVCVAQGYSKRTMHKNYCDRAESLATEIVVMLSPLTELATDGIGIPDVCHHRDGTDTPVPQSLIEPVKTFWSDRSLYTFKIRSFKTDARVLDANNAYETALGELISQCKSKPDFDPKVFQKKQSLLRHARNLLIETLGDVVSDCYIKSN